MQCPQCQHENPDGEPQGNREVVPHSSGAEDTLQVVADLQHAEQRAAQRSAHTEAIGYLSKGLEFLKTLPNTPERLQQELTLHITLGPALLATQGRAAPEVEQVYARARELCQQVEASSRSSRRLLACGAFIWRGRSYRQHVRWENSCSPWPGASTIRALLSRPTIRWGHLVLSGTAGVTDGKFTLG